jgi:hypothetical protein
MVKMLALGFTVLSFTGTLLAADAFTGTWKLNVAASQYAAGMAPKDVTVVVAEKGADMTVSATGTAGDGKPMSVKYSMPLKGGPLSYTEGAPASGVTTTIKRVNASTIDSTSSLNGKEVGSTHAVVSADGKTLTRTVKGVDAQGKAFQNTEVYERQ